MRRRGRVIRAGSPEEEAWRERMACTRGRTTIRADCLTGLSIEAKDMVGECKKKVIINLTSLKSPVSSPASKCGILIT